MHQQGSSSLRTQLGRGWGAHGPQVVGATRPDVGATRPDVGATRPDVGATRPDVGATRPDMGATRPQEPGDPKKKDERDQTTK